MSGRRLPVYLLLDTSGSMQGEPIESVNMGLRAMLTSLRQNPYALESVYLSIHTFDSMIRQVLPLTALEQVVLPEIRCPDSGATLLGEGLQVVCDKVEKEVMKSSNEQKGDWRPLLFIMTDGKPSDTMAFNEMAERVKTMQFASVIACAAGPRAVADQLKQLTTQVVSLDTMDSNTFSSFFQWVSATVAAGTGAAGNQPNLDLPPPPPEVQVVI